MRMPMRQGQNILSVKRASRFVQAITAVRKNPYCLFFAQKTTSISTSRKTRVTRANEVGLH